jgi:hypothetical protein
MGEFDIEWLPILGMNPHREWLANGQLSAHEIDLGIRWDLVVVGGVAESQGKHSLLLQIRFMLEIVRSDVIEERPRQGLRYAQSSW